MSVNVRACSLLLLTIVAAGCSVFEPKPDVTRNYLLSPTAPNRASGDSGPVIGVGPIVLPPYLDRAAIVSRTEPNAIGYSQGHRWAEPLQQNFARVLAADVASTVGTDRIVLFPWYNKPAIDYRVTVDVEQFDHSPGGTAVLVARWKLLRGADGVLLRSGRTSLEQPLKKRTTKAAVAALSRVTAKLADEIAAAIAANP